MGNAPRRLRIASVLGVLATVGPAARADESCRPRTALSSCLSSDNLWPNPAGPFTWLAPAAPPPAPSVAFAFLASYVYRPVGLHISSTDPNGTTIYAVEHALRGHLLASVAIARRLTFDFDAPFIMWQSGAGTSFLTGSELPLPKAAVGDLRFGPAVTILRQRGARGLDLSARLHVVAPTGQERAFVSSPGATFAPGLALAYRVGRVAIGGDVGARVRPHVELGGAVIGSQISLGLGVNVDAVRDQWLTVGAELFALFDLEQQVRQTADPAALVPRETPSSDPLIPMEWLVTARTAHVLDGRFRASVGIGGLVPTGPTTDVTAPLVRAIASVGFVP